jgi:hypothetical protein
VSVEEYHCGVNRFMPLWLRRIMSTHFNSACYLHDEDHNSGVNMDEADKIFLERMQKIAGRNPLLRLQARLYYMAVCVYSSYKKGRES